MASTRRQKVLLVEDKKRYVVKFKHALENLGYTVTVASTVEDAKNHLKHQTFDIVLTDLYFRPRFFPLARAKGLELLKWCKANRVRAELILHSSALNARLTSLFVRRKINVAKALGAQVMPKSKTLEFFKRRLSSMHRI
jgi:DNA-binding NtrC family response regulator